jgi:hypothetical protein
VLFSTIILFEIDTSMIVLTQASTDFVSISALSPWLFFLVGVSTQMNISSAPRIPPLMSVENRN